MSRALVIDDLLQPLEAALEMVANIQNFNREKNEEIVNQAANKILPIIGRVPDFNIFNEKMWAYASGWGRINLRHFAHTVVDRALVVGASSVITELKNYINSSEFPVQQMVFISGIRVVQAVDLAKGIRLEEFYPNAENYRYIPCANPENLSEATYQISAVFIKKDMHPIIYASANRYSKKGVKSELWDFEELNDALLCLALIGKIGPAKVATSISPINWIPAFTGPPGQIPHHVDVGPYDEMNSADISRLKDLYNHFISLNPGFKKKLRLSMERLRLAKCRKWNVDTAIDIGIALEIIFTDLKPFDSSISFILRLRASRLLRTSKSDRLELSKLITNLYKLRSAAAHKGELPKSFDGENSSKILSDGAMLVSEAIEHLILHGEPHWDDVIYE